MYPLFTVLYPLCLIVQINVTTHVIQFIASNRCEAVKHIIAVPYPLINVKCFVKLSNQCCIWCMSIWYNCKVGTLDYFFTLDYFIFTIFFGIILFKYRKLSIQNYIYVYIYIGQLNILVLLLLITHSIIHLVTHYLKM